MSKNFGEGFNKLPATDYIVKLTLSKMGTEEKFTLENIPGKQASVKILFNIKDEHSRIGTQEAQRGLSLYGDYTAEEKQQPDSHPNIRLLMNVIEHDETWLVAAE